MQAPAGGLLIVGIFNWILSALLALVLACLAASAGRRPSPILLFTILAIMLPSSLLIVGTLKMKRLEAYWLAVVAAIFAVIFPPGNLIGLPIGIWALVVLSQREIRDAFAKNKNRGVRDVPPDRDLAGVASGQSSHVRGRTKRAAPVRNVIYVCITFVVGWEVFCWMAPDSERTLDDPAAVAKMSTRQIIEQLPQHTEEHSAWHELEKRLNEGVFVAGRG